MRPDDTTRSLALVLVDGEPALACAGLPLIAWRIRESTVGLPPEQRAGITAALMNLALLNVWSVECKRNLG